MSYTEKELYKAICDRKHIEITGPYAVVYRPVTRGAYRNSTINARLSNRQLLEVLLSKQEVGFQLSIWSY